MSGWVCSKNICPLAGTTDDRSRWGSNRKYEDLILSSSVLSSSYISSLQDKQESMKQKLPYFFFVHFDDFFFFLSEISHTRVLPHPARFFLQAFAKFEDFDHVVTLPFGKVFVAQPLVDYWNL